MACTYAAGHGHGQDLLSHILPCLASFKGATWAFKFALVLGELPKENLPVIDHHPAWSYDLAISSVLLFIRQADKPDHTCNAMLL